MKTEQKCCSQENEKLTKVGISLHKQGQVLDHFIRTENTKNISEQGSNEINLTM